MVQWSVVMMAGSSASTEVASMDALSVAVMGMQ
jgi:hypothetical protein